MYLLLMFFTVLFLVDAYIYFFKKDVFKDKLKISKIRAIELIFMSPLMVAGIMLIKGDKVQDNILFFIGFSLIVIVIGLNKVFLNKKK